MESNMDVVLQTLECENMEMSDSLRDLEVCLLMEKANRLEKALEKEKKFHRKFVDEVIVTEATRLEDFRKEKHTVVEENKSLVREVRQLKKDVDFYKKAHAELAKEEAKESGVVNKSAKKINQPPGTASSSKSTSRSESQTIVYRSLPSECTHKSSKVLSKVNEKLFIEKKKLQSKISNLTATNAILKKNIKSLENFRTKIDNKKAKFCLDSEELERLVDSTQKNKNKDTYNSQALAMLARLP